ncbi:hypothetical protein Poli38472_001864 [Pythium oligandrum]|uniref:Uncharacterized protein n=1 Tax=Pythium oligandrum TaxID=41045 RepID=A0A8K1CVI0_PYTOL|nr:hypothetical protein Poli38472_001864 [Pythium oligandrum]|eukprot:TMW69708.1 hypothetical protein Poli38472_001864 [Pythium oligandrum]
MAESATTYCLYPSKPCFNPRAVKVGGKPHKLCEEHRRKANENQQRCLYRKRLRELEAMQERMDEEFDNAQRLIDETMIAVGALGDDDDLTEEDLAILVALLDE